MPMSIRYPLIIVAARMDSPHPRLKPHRESVRETVKEEGRTDDAQWLT
jgi:hypothetical protein